MPGVRFLDLSMTATPSVSDQSSRARLSKRVIGNKTRYQRVIHVRTATSVILRMDRNLIRYNYEQLDAQSCQIVVGIES